MAEEDVEEEGEDGNIGVEEEEDGNTDDELEISDEAEVLGNSEKDEATKYLRMLRTAKFTYLDDVDKEYLPAVVEFLPLVYTGDPTSSGNQKEVQQVLEREEEMAAAWDKAWEKKWGSTSAE